MQWRPLLVVAVVLAAGCGAPFATDAEDPDRTTTLTPAPVPEVTPTPEAWPVAPGVSTTGIADLEVLIAAHRTATANTSYVWRERSGTAVTPNGSVPMFDRGIAKVAASDRYYAWTSEERVRLESGLRHVANYSEFTDGQIRTIRYRLVGRSGYEYQRRPSVSASFNAFVGGAAVDAMRRYLAVERAVVSRTRVDGERYYLVTGRGWTRFAGGEVSNYSVTALVSDDGFVRSLNANYTVTTVGQPRRVRYAFAYERVGNTTVDRPPWAESRRR